MSFPTFFVLFFLSYTIDVKEKRLHKAERRKRRSDSKRRPLKLSSLLFSSAPISLPDRCPRNTITRERETRRSESASKMEEMLAVILSMLLVFALIPLFIWKRRHDSRSQREEEVEEEPQVLFHSSLSRALIFFFCSS